MPDIDLSLNLFNYNKKERAERNRMRERIKERGQTPDGERNEHATVCIPPVYHPHCVLALFCQAILFLLSLHDVVRTVPTNINKLNTNISQK